jgi:hypothetical protein
MFPPFLNIIHLVGLNVRIQIIQDFLKCYFWNIVIPTYPHFVIMQKWNWNKKYFINFSSSNFAYLNISKISFWNFLLNNLIILHEYCLYFLSLKYLVFARWPLGWTSHSYNHLVATWHSSSYTWWPPSCDMCVIRPCYYRILGQNYLSIFWTST